MNSLKSAANPKLYCLVNTLTSVTNAGDNAALIINSTRKLVPITAAIAASKDG